jgi:hypothetical protein
MKRTSISAFVVLLFIALIAPLHAAQPSAELTQTYISETLELAFQYPEGWSGTEFKALGRNSTILSNGNMDPEQLAADEIWVVIGDYQNFTGDANPEARRDAAMNSSLYDFTSGTLIDDPNGVEIEVDGHSIFYMEFKTSLNGAINGMWVGMGYNQNRYLSGIVRAGSNETFDAMRETILAIFASARDAQNEELTAIKGREVIDDFAVDDGSFPQSNGVLSVVLPPEASIMASSQTYSLAYNMGLPDTGTEMWFRTGESIYFRVSPAEYPGLSTRQNLLSRDEFYAIGEYEYVMLNGRAAVIYSDSENTSFRVIGVRLEKGEIIIVRAINAEGAAITDEDMRTAYTLAAYAEAQQYDFTALEPLQEQGIQLGPTIDGLMIRVDDSDSVTIGATYHDPDGDANVINYMVTQTFGGEFASRPGALLSSLENTGESGKVYMTYNCDPNNNLVNVVEIYLEDDLRNAGDSRFVRVTCSNGEASAIELSSEEADIPLEEALGAPADVTSNTAPEIVNVAFETAPLTPVIVIDLTYKDLEGDANTINMKMVDSDGPLFDAVNDPLETTYADQSKGTALEQRFISCIGVSGTFTLEVTITDAQNNSSEGVLVHLDCDFENPSGTVVTQDSISAVDLPVGVPVIRDITFEGTFVEDKQAVEMVITYGDAEGDAIDANFKVVEGDVINFRDTTQSLGGDSFLQQRGNATLKFTWTCSKESAFSNTIQLVLSDAQGNPSQPAVFQVNCELVGNQTAGGSLVSIEGVTEIAAQPTRTAIESTVETPSTPVITATVPPTPLPTSTPEIPVDPNCPSLPAQLVVGEMGQSIRDGEGATNIRPNPGLGQPVGKIQEGESFLVIGDPVCGISRNGDRLRYFLIETNYGLQGWIPEASDERYFMEPGSNDRG